MKYRKLSLCALLIGALALIPLIGCSDQTATEPEGADSTFTYSSGIDENGYWEGVTALDYVTLPDYSSIEIPSSVHTIEDDAVQAQIEVYLENYSTSEQITDRAIVDGDTVNIDYVGSIDGVEFDGGNTNGAGAEVTIGVTTYIDDFLEQLIGHTPGETINIEVTFPDDYSTAELAGKDAVFVTTINYIVETTAPELTDEFVLENLSPTYGWTTVEEMEEGAREELRQAAIRSHLQQFIVDESTVSSIPDQLIEYQNSAMIRNYEDYAAYYGISLEEFITTYLDADSVESLIEANEEASRNSASFSLIIQAFAESMDIIPTEEDLAETLGTDDYTAYEEQYGLPFLKQVALSDLVMNRLADNTVLA